MLDIGISLLTWEVVYVTLGHNCRIEMLKLAYEKPYSLAFGVFHGLVSAP